VDEDYPARPEIKQSLPGCDEAITVAENRPCTLETDVCVWRYAPLVVLATQEEEEEEVIIICLISFGDNYHQNTQQSGSSNLHQ